MHYIVYYIVYLIAYHIVYYIVYYKVPLPPRTPPGSRVDRIDIVGSRGRISFSTFELDQPLTLARASAEPEQFLLPPPAHVQEPLIRTIVEALQGHGSCPSTGVTAARTSHVMDCVVASRS